jgi:hypothetical protein
MLLRRETNLVLFVMGRIEEPLHNLQQSCLVVQHPSPIDVLQVEVEEAFRLA